MLIFNLRKYNLYFIQEHHHLFINFTNMSFNRILTSITIGAVERSRKTITVSAATETLDRTRPESVARSIKGPAEAAVSRNTNKTPQGMVKVCVK